MLQKCHIGKFERDHSASVSGQNRQFVLYYNRFIGGKINVTTDKISNSRALVSAKLRSDAQAIINRIYKDSKELEAIFTFLNQESK